MDEYQKTCSRDWAVMHSMKINKGKRVTVNKILSDAAIIHSFISDKKPVDVITLAKTDSK